MDLTNIKENYSKDLNEIISFANGFTKELKAESLKNFNAKGLPTKKWEDWKYTNVSPLLTESLSNDSQKVKIDDVFIDTFKFDDNAKVVFVNGWLDGEYTKLPEGVELEYYSANQSESEDNAEVKKIMTLAANEKESFTNLNTVCASEIIMLKVGKSVVLKKPIAVFHISTKEAKGSTLTSKMIIKSEQFSEATVVEYFLHEEEVHYVQNSHTTCIVEAGASLDHIKTQSESSLALHVGKVHAEVAQDARFYSFTFSVGGKMVRNDLEINLNERGAYASVDGLFALREDQHHDNFSLINHRVEHTDSDQLFKGILDEESHGCFTGKVFVHRNAQLVNASQLNKNLLLSKKAHIDTRPQLEVYADDVKCAHGATIGQISEEQTFYLESRGIPRAQAQKILCRAFASDAINKVRNPLIKEKLSTLLFNSFEKFALEHIGQEQK